MKTFTCSCETRHILFFESNTCLACKRVVGLDDHFDKVEAYDLDEQSGHYFKADTPTIAFRKCDNHAQYQACNGMVKINSAEESDDKEEQLCFACRFNETIPNLSIEAHIPLWKKMEAAKRRALFTLKALSLPLKTRQQDPKNGLSFDFITDRDVNDHFSSKLDNHEAVFTGHNCGHITINLAEADEVARSHTKQAMGEHYRTLLGYFRHELGHYYFDRLITHSAEKHALCKGYFGDDTLDYQEALNRHYKHGAPANWRQDFISEYATMHPYEDWAETWAHYMHIIDTLETAQNFSLAGSTKEAPSTGSPNNALSLPQDTYFFSSQTTIDTILNRWIDFSIILNSLNRSMGMNDAYPFVLTKPVRIKLSFIHHAIHHQLDSLPPASMA
ncbi:MAG: putative zinc-binding metallopeptidase [Oleiphilus sp.]